MHTFSKNTLSALQRSGWYPERRIDISDELKIFERENYPIFPVVLDFLKQFGKLQIVYSISHIVEGHTSQFYFEIERALKMFRRETVDTYMEDSGIVFCPIGITKSSLFLVMSADGKVYGIYKDMLFIGESGEQAIENIINRNPSNPFPIIPDLPGRE